MPKPNAFRYLDTWQTLSDADADAIRDFWLREQANVDGPEAIRRAQQVVVRVLAANDELVALSTVESRTIPRLLQPMYYYRCFVAAAWRDHKLLRPLLCRSFEALNDWAREHDYPCLGVLLELENEGFTRSLQKANWRVSPQIGFTFIGRSRKGQDLRVCYFPGARLKTPEQLAALLQPTTTAPAVDA